MASDEVVPFRFWDQNNILSKLVMEFTYRFDDVLNAEKLKTSLNRLLEIGEWRQMGTRLRKNTAGKLEYHIPAKYDDKRPGFTWSHERVNQRIRDHPLAAKIPNAAGIKRPTLFRPAEELHDLITSEGHATKFSDWTDTDRPALEVHVTSFEDATLLTLSWSHVILDALGRQTLLKAWIAVLEGREEDVPDFVPLHVDPASSIAKGGDPRQHMLYRYALTGIWFALFVLGYIYELIIHSAESGRTICCPGTWVENLREQAMADAAASSHDEKSVFLSHGDVLLAWWTKVSVAAQQFGPNQPINVMNTTNLRGVFPNHLPDKENTAYTTNATIATHTLTTSGELSSLSVGAFALRLRQDLQKQRNPEQARHNVAWQIESHQRHGSPPVIGKWNQIMLVCSNWHRARFFDMDFSSAVVRAGTPLESRANKLGRPSFIISNGHTDNLNLRNAGPLIGRDSNGDWWLSWSLRAKAWDRVQEYFERL